MRHASAGGLPAEVGLGRNLDTGRAWLIDGLCKITGNGSSMHVGLLLFEDLIPTPMKTSAPMSRKQTGESIPSIDAYPQQQEAASPRMLVVRSFSR